MSNIGSNFQVPDIFEMDEHLKTRLTNNYKGFWNTRQIIDVDGHDPDNSVLFNMRELILHLIFFIIVLIVLFEEINPKSYVVTQLVTQKLIAQPFPVFEPDQKFNTISSLNVTFMEIKHVDEVHSSSLDCFFQKIKSGPKKIYISHQYFFYLFNAIDDFGSFKSNRKNGDKPTETANQTNVTEKTIGEQFHTILGLVNVRQLRVREDTCDYTFPHSNFTKRYALNRKCYGYYSYANEYTEDITNRSFAVNTPFKWVIQSAQNIPSFTGHVSKYPGTGFHMPLNKYSKNITRDTLEYMRASDWLDAATRAIFIEFTTYSVNLNLFTIIRLVLEFTPSGAIFPSYRINTLKFINDSTWFELFALINTFFMAAFIVLYALQEIFEFAYFKFDYFKYFWNYVDLAIILLATLVLINVTARNREGESKILDFLARSSNDFITFETLRDMHQWFLVLVTLLLIAMILKLYKYLARTRDITDLVNLLVPYVAIFTIVFVAFALGGYYLFGNHLMEFKSLFNSAMSVFYVTIGSGAIYSTVYKVNRFYGPIFYVAVVLLFRVLILARDDSMSHTSQIRCAFNDDEINLFLKKYHVNENLMADCDELIEILLDLDARDFKVERNSMIEALKEDLHRLGIYSEEEARNLREIILKDRDTIQARITLVEIQIESMCERVNRLLIVLQRSIE